jgi:serine/threonine protein kinase
MTLTTHGTEYFRDPELVRQAMRGVKVHQVDGSKFDVFGAGAVLYFMLENTFPAHGGLSDFSKESPECIRWVVRRAMADYDKRYHSIKEMLADVETILSAKHISGVRPADLPSMGGESPKESVRRLPARTTPSTGGGPFKQQQFKTKPLGLVVLLVALAVGAAVVINENHTDVVVAVPAKLIQIPTGKVLVLNELSTSQSREAKKAASNKIAELSVSGWNLFIDADTEANVRSWLPSDPTNNPIPLSKLEVEGISGILLIQESEESLPSMYFVNQNGMVLLP